MAQSVTPRTFGPALVGIDCVYIGCAQSVEIVLTESTRDLSCDRRLGTNGIFHFDPNLQINIQASDFTMDNLAITLDTTGPSTWGGTDTSTLEEISVTWTGSTGEWSGTITLNEEISGTVALFNDSDGSTEWTQAESGTVSVSDACKGTVVLTSSGSAEPSTTLYGTYAWGDQVPSGSTIVQPGFGSTSNDRYLVIVHKKAQEDKVIVWRFWKTQVVRDLSINFDNESDADITVPITMRALTDTTGHASVPIFDVSEVTLTGWSPDYDPYDELVNVYG